MDDPGSKKNVDRFLAGNQYRFTAPSSPAW
jgi:hypothetical protein